MGVSCVWRRPDRRRTGPQSANRARPAGNALGKAPIKNWTSVLVGGGHGARGWTPAPGMPCPRGQSLGDPADVRGHGSRADLLRPPDGRGGPVRGRWLRGRAAGGGLLFPAAGAPRSTYDEATRAADEGARSSSPPAGLRVLRAAGVGAGSRRTGSGRLGGHLGRSAGCGLRPVRQERERDRSHRGDRRGCGDEPAAARVRAALGL